MEEAAELEASKEESDCSQRKSMSVLGEGESLVLIWTV